jgi:hypothetical protein
VRIAGGSLPGDDRIWGQNENFAQEFRIGVMVARGVQFCVNVYAITGVVSANTGSATEGELLGSYLFTVDPADADPTDADRAIYTIFMPTVNR